MTIQENPAIDVSHLPTTQFGHHEPLWWGVLLAVVIETTGFALVWSTYLYLRMQEATWPPWRWSAPDVLIGSISTVVILATALPMMLIAKAAKRLEEERVRRLIILFFGVCAIACAVRVWEFIGLQVKWDSNAIRLYRLGHADPAYSASCHVNCGSRTSWLCMFSFVHWTSGMLWIGKSRRSTGISLWDRGYRMLYCFTSVRIF